MLKALMGVAVGVILVTIYYILPVLKPFPMPTGPYIIGTQRAWIVDKNRNDPYSENGGPRIIRACFWYPASSENETSYPYLGGMMPHFQRLYAQLYSIPEWINRILWRGIMTHAYSDAELSPARQKYPVVIFSHGLLGLPSEMYVSLIENIVSHGYIVVALDHPYFNVMTEYPDKKFVSCQEISSRFETRDRRSSRNFLRWQ